MMNNQKQQKQYTLKMWRVAILPYIIALPLIFLLQALGISQNIGLLGWLLFLLLPPIIAPWMLFLFSKHKKQWKWLLTLELMNFLLLMIYVIYSYYFDENIDIIPGGAVILSIVLWLSWEKNIDKNISPIKKIENEKS